MRGDAVLLALLLSAVLLNVHCLALILNCPLPTTTDVTALVQELDQNATVTSYNFSCFAYGNRMNSYQSVGFIAQDTDFNFYYITAQCNEHRGWNITDGERPALQVPSNFTGQTQENCYSCVLLSNGDEIACLGKHNKCM